MTITAIAEVQAAVDALDIAVREEFGITYRPYGQTSIDFRAHTQPRVYIPASDKDGGSIFVNGETIDDALAETYAKLSEMGSAEERALRDFQKSLAALIDKGREAGIPVEFVNPLADMAKKLAENAITDQRGSTA